MSLTPNEGGKKTFDAFMLSIISSGSHSVEGSNGGQRGHWVLCRVMLVIVLSFFQGVVMMVGIYGGGDSSG